VLKTDSAFVKKKLQTYKFTVFKLKSFHRHKPKKQQKPAATAKMPQILPETGPTLLPLLP